jgi:Uma2 family endonuclease
MLTNVQRKMFTTGEYHRMIEAGILGEDDRIELIKGEIIHMAAAIGSQHAACVNRLTQLFVENFAGKAIIHVQNPVSIGKHSEPEPDIALLKFREDFYAETHPEPEDVLLIVEIADTSLEYDRETKLPLYAKAGIREAWIVNLKEGCLEVYTNPSGQGYNSLKKYRKGERAAPGIFPDVHFRADEIIGQWKYPLTV